MVAREVINVFSESSFRILIGKAPNAVINLAKNQQVALTFPPHLEIFHHKKDEPSSYLFSRLLPNSDIAVHYESTPYRIRKTQGQQPVQENDNDSIDSDCPEEVTIAYRYKKTTCIPKYAKWALGNAR